MKRIVSWGGGTQSSAISLLVLRGELPRPDLFLFADTGDEPAEVYDNVEMWREMLAADGLELRTVRHSKRTLFEEILRTVALGHWTSIPWWIEERDDPNKRQPVRRGCTQRWKVEPLNRAQRRFAGVPRGHKGAPLVETWLGISRDEIQRMKVSTLRWQVFRYPLIDDRPMRRSDCVRLLADAGLPIVRSACTFCPFRLNREWRHLRDEDPAGWAQAVEVDRLMREAWDSGRVPSVQSRPTVHRSGLPLAEADLGDDQAEMFGGFDNECLGVCGV